MSLIALFLINIAYGQDYQKISSEIFIKNFKEVVEKYNSENSLYKFTKEFYDDLKSNKLINTSTGTFFYGRDKCYRLEDEKTLVIQNNELKVVIDSVENHIVISQPDTTFNPINSIANLNEKNLKKYNIYQIITEKYTQFKVESKELNESVIEFLIDNETKNLYKLIITFPTANYFSDDITDETLEQPYVIILYNAPIKFSNPSSFFDLSSIFNLSEKGIIQLNKSYINFKLYDTRYKSSKN